LFQFTLYLGSYRLPWPSTACDHHVDRPFANLIHLVLADILRTEVVSRRTIQAWIFIIELLFNPCQIETAANLGR